MKRDLFTQDHDEFRGAVREFVDREVTPNVERWEEDRLIDRDLWIAAGKQGIIGLSCDEVHGGAGQARDYRFRTVVIEELANAHASSLSSSFALQDDIVVPYISGIGSDDQKTRWLPGLARGEVIGAIAMTEPGTGSDLRAIRTAGTKVDGGWLVNGSKTFITSGIQSDLVITVVRTDPKGGSRGLSLMVIERGSPGFSRGRKLKKVGLHGQDTAELFFENVFVPDADVLGEIGGGLSQLIHHLPIERLSIAVQAVSSSRAVFESTVKYTDERVAFGQPIADFQNTRFVLADVSIEIDVTQAFVDLAIKAFNDDRLTVVDAAKAKIWASESQGKIIDRCLQLHGGYGYMLEYPVARAYQDARVQRIFGGSNEVLRQVVGRDIVGRR